LDLQLFKIGLAARQANVRRKIFLVFMSLCSCFM
jgi:hypothetical protein